MKQRFILEFDSYEEMQEVISRQDDHSSPIEVDIFKDQVVAATNKIRQKLKMGRFVPFDSTDLYTPMFMGYIIGVLAKEGTFTYVSKATSVGDKILQTAIYKGKLKKYTLPFSKACVDQFNRVLEEIAPMRSIKTFNEVIAISKWRV